ncbi:Glycosyl phosphatidyl inositol protein transamidase complex subunit [Lunasporangiospora selenospora]|uniref:Glycosyl phosphatidyl inositol protein transamidase complex subunit n=1 Tax=Lunasporangiospora selenospora TaxID=979761 RepID=A0A9P6KIU0_9FUNG|nr:Glycosyl phosphatidyl inositol protein transamidase complex subunit [Lunasporangiospora selenospora]
MGLLSRLSKTQRRQLFSRFALYIMPKLSYLLVAVSFIWLLALPHQSYSKRTYISENALLPGGANVRFEYGDSIVAETLRETVQRISSYPAKERAEALEQEFTQIGLKAATQNYTLNTSTTSKFGVNTYAVFYAPRSDGTEALVISAPWTSRDGVTNTNGVTVLLALARVFKRCSHFSKDIIFVSSDGDYEGLQAWLRAYHGLEQNDSARKEDPLTARSGAIQAALNLDFAGTGDYNALGIFFEGVNGQLPNLDLINTVADIAGGIAPVELTLHDELIPTTENMTKNYINALKRMLNMMKYQATGVPSGNHGLYLKYKIDAITLYGIDKPGWNSHRFGLHKIGVIVESTVRSLNNLLEHFHQSFFFYLLSAVDRYTSIGLYMPPVIILGVSFIFQALSLWGQSGDLPLELESITKGENVPIGLPYLRRKRNIRVPATIVGMSFVVGLASFYLITTDFGFVGETPLIKLISSLGVSIMLVFTGVSSAHVRHRVLQSSKAPKSSEPQPAADWVVLKSITLALSALFVTTLSALNFSFAVSIGLVIALPYLMFRPSRWMIFNIVQVLILIAISPPGLALFASHQYSLDVNLILRWVLEGYEVLGTWLLPALCLVYWPLNLSSIMMVLLPAF